MAVLAVGWLVCWLVDDQDEFAVGVVEGDEGIGVEEDGVGEVAVGGVADGGFKEADGVVAQVADEAAREPGEAGEVLIGVGHVGGELGAEGVEGVGIFGEVGDGRGVRLSFLAGDVRFEAASAEDVGGAGVEADEGVARDVFAPGDGFEEEGGAVSSEFEIDGDGGF